MQQCDCSEQFSHKDFVFFYTDLCVAQEAKEKKNRTQGSISPFESQVCILTAVRVT